MSLTNRALWVIDRHLGRPLTLGEIAEACSVSRHHLAHAFGEAVGLTVMDYARSRRLSEAARALARGASNILELALESGYGSHEAFSRAFRAQFGATPESVRRSGSVEGLALLAPILLPERQGAKLEPPRWEGAGEILAVGLRERRSFTDGGLAITAQWRRFGPEVGAIANQAQPIPLGILIGADWEGGFDYACAVEVRDFSQAPRDLARVRVPAQAYAVFRHSAHVSTLGATYSAILDHWLPDGGRTLADGPSLERHAPSFDPLTGDGGLEVWLPLA
jgi:AraC family transcriptional regulator